MIISRPYDGAPDLDKLQAFTSQNIARFGDCGQLHVGDIPHRIYNNLRRYDPATVVNLWEDDHRDLLGWALLSPKKFASFEFYVRPDLWSSDLPQQVLTWTESRMIELLRQQGDITTLNTETMDCDTARTTLYEANGYVFDKHDFIVSTRELVASIPQPTLPAGYIIRSAAGDHEADKLAAVHSAFNSNWTADEYRTLMNTPGYDADREMVVVAPDGTFAAFTVTWIDTLNKIMLFEPVGVHKDYQRKGLGRALMLTAMHRYKAQGIQTAEVGYEIENPASSGLYTSLGFIPKHKVNVYQKKIE